MYKKNLAENEHFIQDKDGKIIPMRYAQTEAEINVLLEKFKDIYSIKIEEYDHREVRNEKTDIMSDKYDHLLEYSKNNQIKIPLKQLVALIEKYQKNSNLKYGVYYLEDLYSSEDNIKIFVYFLQKIYEQNNPLKNGTDLVSWKIPEFLPEKVPSIRQRDRQPIIDEFNKIIGKPLSHQGIVIDDVKKHRTHDEESKALSKFPDNYQYMQRDALYNFIEIIYTLYSKPTIQKFVISPDFEKFKEKLFSYYDPPDFDSHSKSATTEQIALLLMYFIGKPDKYNFNL